MRRCHSLCVICSLLLTIASASATCRGRSYSAHSDSGHVVVSPRSVGYAKPSGPINPRAKERLAVGLACSHPGRAACQCNTAAPSNPRSTAVPPGHTRSYRSSFRWARHCLIITRRNAYAGFRASSFASSRTPSLRGRGSQARWVLTIRSSGPLRIGGSAIMP